jgi:cytochrome bd-type quinol oxidase subunit 2
MKIGYIVIFLSVVLLFIGIVFSVNVCDKDTTANDKLSSLSKYAYGYLGGGVLFIIIIAILKHKEYISKWKTVGYLLIPPIVFIGISSYLLILKNSKLDDSALLSELIKLSISTTAIGAFMLGFSVHLFNKKEKSYKEPFKANAWEDVP